MPVCNATTGRYLFKWLFIFTQSQKFQQVTTAFWNWVSAHSAVSARPDNMKNYWRYLLLSLSEKWDVFLKWLINIPSWHLLSYYLLFFNPFRPGVHICAILWPYSSFEIKFITQERYIQICWSMFCENVVWWRFWYIFFFFYRMVWVGCYSRRIFVFRNSKKIKCTYLLGRNK